MSFDIGIVIVIINGHLGAVDSPASAVGVIFKLWHGCPAGGKESILFAFGNEIKIISAAVDIPFLTVCSGVCRKTDGSRGGQRLCVVALLGDFIKTVSEMGKFIFEIVYRSFIVGDGSVSARQGGLEIQAVIGAAQAVNFSRCNVWIFLL